MPRRSFPQASPRAENSHLPFRSSRSVQSAPIIKMLTTTPARKRQETSDKRKTACTGRAAVGHRRADQTRPTMAQRSNHYEAAFEGFIRSIRVPCVAVDEAKRAICGDDGSRIPISCFIRGSGPTWWSRSRVRGPRIARGRRDWENWVTTDDLDGLVRWQAMFGPGFRAVLAFAYAEPIGPFPFRETMVPSSSAASNIASGPSDSTIMSPTSDHAGRPGRPSRWPGGPFAAGFALYSNGCR